MLLAGERLTLNQHRLCVLSQLNNMSHVIRRPPIYESGCTMVITFLHVDKSIIPAATKWLYAEIQIAYDNMSEEERTRVVDLSATFIHNGNNVRMIMDSTHEHAVHNISDETLANVFG